MDFSQSISPVNGRRLMLVVVVMVSIVACHSVAGNAGNYLRCYTDKKDTGICVKRKLCINETIDTVGAEVIQPRLNDIVECNEFDEVCCGLPPIEPDSEESLSVGSTSSEDEPDDPDWSRQCGQRTNVSERTDPENETNRFEFPWNVAIFSVTEFRRKRRKEFLCSGTLIDDYIVLTAARCVHLKNRATLWVELGRWDLNAGEEPRTQELAVDLLIVHPGFKASSYVNNIALLMLATGAQLGKAANRVCLADGSITFDADSLCHVVGWSNSPTPETGNRQLKLRSSFATAQRCTESIRRATNAWEFVLPKENLCPSYLDTNVPCERAPGSGLVCESPHTDGQFFLVGIASYAVRNCHQYRAYDVFLAIADYIEWIDRRVEEQNRETSFYRPDPIGFSK